MTTGRSSPRPNRTPDQELEALLAACRVLVAISAKSIAAVEDVANVTQVRALVVVASHGSVSLGELAEAANIHLTRASRLCDRLVLKGLINRADDPANRRQLNLTLTPSGKRVVRAGDGQSRKAIEPILARMTRQMSAERRSEFVAMLQDFAAAAGEPAESDLWAMGWTT